MLPQKQTIFGEGGNCFSACIASICDLPLSEVPVFGEHGYWYFEVIDFLHRHGFVIHGKIMKESFPLWYKHYEGVDGYFIVGGGSPRMIKNGHAVIYKEDTPFFDPHPDDTFLTKEEEVYLIKKI
jgi:hypothetical protein